jgi:Mg/Co/Ni transporter MgtE
MTTQSATKPELSLAQMIDIRLSLDEQIKALEESKKSLAEKIIAAMQENEQAKAFGFAEKGYRLQSSIKADYKAESINYVKVQKIAHLFQSEPKVTRSKVMDALKKGTISQAQFKKLQSFAGKEYEEFTLVTVKEKVEDD